MTKPLDTAGYDKVADIWESHDHFKLYHENLEKKAMNDIMDVASADGQKCLCIGVGAGYELGQILNKGWKVNALDYSKELLKIAESKYPEVDFKNISLDDIDENYDAKSFDYIYSSLAFHYSVTLEQFAKKCFELLKENGVLQFSTTHPVFDTAGEYKDGNTSFKGMGIIKKGAEKVFLGTYFDEKVYKQIWGEGVEMEFMHRTLSSWINAFLGAGFKLDVVVEPKPSEDMREVNLDFYKKYTARPVFIIFKFRK